MWKSARASKRARQAGSGWVRDGARHTSMLRGIKPVLLHVEELSLASSAPRRDGLDVEQPSRRVSSEVLEAHLLLLLLDRLRHRCCSVIARQLHLFRCQRGRGERGRGRGIFIGGAFFSRRLPGCRLCPMSHLHEVRVHLAGFFPRCQRRSVNCLPHRVLGGVVHAPGWPWLGPGALRRGRQALQPRRAAW